MLFEKWEDKLDIAFMFKAFIIGKIRYVEIIVVMTSKDVGMGETRINQ